LLYPIQRTNGRAKDVAKVLDGYSSAPRKFPPSVVQITSPEEVDKAWANLELFPLKASSDLDVIRVENI
jgi:hypothetical protein